MQGLFDAFWDKFGPKGRSRELAAETLGSPHCEIAMLTDEETKQPIAGHIYFSFHELGFAFSDILGGDTLELKQQMWEQSTPIPHTVYSINELPGSVQLVDGLYVLSDTTVSGKDAATALYLYWQMAYGVQDPVQDENYMKLAAAVYNM